MNTHDIELPPLPASEEVTRQLEKAFPWVEVHILMVDYARTATEPYAKRIAELEAARIAYASEFPPNEDGDPDSGSIHENIRKLKADRKRGGEPVGEAGTMPGTNGFTMAVFKAEDVPVGTKVYTAPQPAEPVEYKPEYKYCADGKVVWVNAADAPVVKSSEPVKVPSNDEILSLWMRHGAAVDFARALLARYGN